MRDLVSNLAVRESIRPAVNSAATVTGQSVDKLGFDAVMAVANVGAIVSAGNVTLKWQESVNNSDWTDVAADDVLTPFPAALVANSVVNSGYIGNARYVRIFGTLNSGTSVAYGASIVLGNPAQFPTA